MTTIVVTRPCAAETGGGQWRAGETYTASTSYAQFLIGRGDAYSIDGSLDDISITSKVVTAEAFAAFVAASALITGAIYRVGTPEVWYRATGATTYEALGADPGDISTPGTGTIYAPSIVKSIGFSNAVAAAMEALSDAMPKNAQANTPTVPEQGVIELGCGSWTLEKTLDINLTGASVSRYGLTIRGQGVSSTQLLVPSAAAPAAFKGGDGIWRALSIGADGGGKVSNLRLEGFAVLSYATQGGDGSTYLADPCRWLDLKSATGSRLESMYVYMRRPTALSLNQYLYSLSSCYYTSLDDVRAYVQPSNVNGIAVNGTSKARKGGVGFRLESNNAITITAPYCFGANLCFHLIDEDGASIIGGYSEGHNKVILFGGDSNGNRMLAHRAEFNHAVSTIPMESLSEIYLAQFAEGTALNYVEQYSKTPIGSDRNEYGAAGTNRVSVLTRHVPTPYPATNLITGWTNGSGVTTASNADVPAKLDPSIASSTEITATGSFNQNRYSNAITVDPDLGSVWYRVLCKRISGAGMLSPELVSNTPGSSIVYGATPQQTPLSWSMATLPVSGVAWAGGKLTVTFSVPHGFQAGMRIRNAVAWGTLAINSEMYVESSTEFTAVLIAAAAGTISDPGVVTVPTTASVVSPMDRWLGCADITGDWREFAANIQIRFNVTVAPVLDGSNYAVVAVGLLNLTTGAKVKLSGFADARINGAYTVLSGDITGENLTLSGRGAMVGLNAAATGHDSTTAGFYGQVGLTELKAQWRVTTTNTAQPIVWRIAGEQVMQGPRC